ncbi:tRNA pseudouridine(55) synthase TruB [Phormidesmis priestleyi ULC007]|uniref:tRNA pseudouridine synthase B n=1 Tax=Phormidesmis priestleyi ULC007 TaxID=1920490 RepID=A0A2T1DE86_9CYAN|nr:tRNA pseudouridine(55) synthase TruB [Phormidesmis priestleyi]PSB18751.1 tRNA pseudouridine(55) synthase TruB [Phormidesmis priestleyi ULC007]PZO51608.1 MAG: tRNA pseudouridine(55) synthase TruB [Phormidesmis priestleyi]
MNGFLNLNKPLGFTSHDCVAKVRRILKLKRVGHAGTLDPAATGVLPIALGRATRLLQYLPSDKAYHATICFGLTTATDDLEGEVLAKQPASGLTLEAVKSKLPLFQGTIQQVPPNYSAIQVQGKRLYDLARSGELIEVPARSVDIYQLEILDWRSGEFPELDLAIACGSGTYIRSIARDLGAMLDVGGTLAKLIRTDSSGFTLSDSLTLDEFATQVQDQAFSPIDPDIALAHLPIFTLPEEPAKRWRWGQKVVTDEVINAAIVRVRHEDNRFLGIAQLVESEEGRLLIPQMVFEPIS